jgi:hypothetical protein
MLQHQNKIKLIECNLSNGITLEFNKFKPVSNPDNEQRSKLNLNGSYKLYLFKSLKPLKPFCRLFRQSLRQPKLKSPSYIPLCFKLSIYRGLISYELKGFVMFFFSFFPPVFKITTRKKYNTHLNYQSLQKCHNPLKSYARIVVVTDIQYSIQVYQ